MNEQELLLKIASDKKIQLWHEACCRQAKVYGPITKTPVDKVIDVWFDKNDEVLNLRFPFEERINLLREIVGNPHRPVGTLLIREVKKAKDIPGRENFMFGELQTERVPWLTPTVKQLAQAIYDSDQWEDMPILGDALEEAGCADEDILRHCRQQERCAACLGSGACFACQGSGFNGMSSGYDGVCDDCGGRGDCFDCRKTGWIPKRTPCVRGCWVVDLILNQK